ncbi:OmpA family protein [Flavobacterium sp. GCM10023249]|uniref:OmpA family protein n=1 Tax=unclassified Flavobacterium TaxID=196869 RepID=UPI0036235518
MRKAITLSLVLFSSIFYGQQKLKAANEMFNEMSYVDASKLYEEYAEKNSDLSVETMTNIADTYYNLNDMRKALTWYQKLYDIQGQNLSDLYLLRYTQALRGVRDYDKANAVTKEALRKKNDNALIKHFTQNQKHLDSLSKKKSLYDIKNLSNNSPNSDFGATFYGNKVVYSSAKEEGTVTKKIYSWNEQPYLAMYVADRNGSDGSLFNEQPFLSDIASKYHDATITFSNDLKTFYYTTNTMKGNRLKNDKKGTNNFQIIKATIENDKSTKGEKLFFNSLDYSVGHPSLSPDGKWLFFVSDMPGGYGETDIYVVEVFGDGTMNSPRNLGPKINTVGREMFPFFSEGKLYFSSEGHYGFGGLDIFESKQTGNEFSSPKNLGEPVNSNKDDFSFILDTKGKYGYFSSNRDTGKGDDDIYYFTKSEPECNQMVVGKVVNSKTKLGIDEASIKVLDSFGDLKYEYFTDANGKFEFQVPCVGNFKLIASKPNFSTQDKEIKIGDVNGDTNTVDFELAKLDDFVVKDNGNEKIDINPIFFNYDKWDITPQAATELDKVVYVMANFPKVKIRIESHTDSRGKDLYNLKLSDNRAKSTQTYILSKGISANRIESAVGFGETRLRNNCKNGIKCSEEDHFTNRRSDFIIVEK